MADDDLEYKIDIWNQRGGIDRTLARLSDLMMARAAFDAAVERYSEANLTLRLGARVIREHPDPRNALG